MTGGTKGVPPLRGRRVSGEGAAARPDRGGATRAGARVLPFRRRQFVARRRRRNPWLALARSFGISALLVAVPLMVAGWIWQGPHFRLRRVEVVGCHHIEEEWVRDQLAPLIGRPLLTLRLSAVADRMRRNPWVGEVALEKRLPDGMRLVLEERRPAAVHRDEEGGLRYVDAEGESIVAYAPGAGPADLPLVSGSAEAAQVAAAVRLARELARQEPKWGRRISEIQVLGSGDFRVFSAHHRFPILLSLQHLDDAVDALRRHRQVLEQTFPEVAQVDLRFGRQIIIREL